MKDVNERYFSLIENMNNGLIVLESTLDGDFKINQINKIALEMDCLNEEDVIENLFSMIFPCINKNGLLEIINRVFNTGKSESTTLKLFDHELSGWRENYIYKLSTDEIAIIYKDETTQKELEEKLKKENKLKKDILNNLQEMIWLKDKQGIYLSCNNKFEDYFGTTEKNIVGNTDYDFVSPLTATMFRNNDAIAMASDSMYKNEEWVTYPNGKRVLFSTTKTPMKNSNNELLGILGVARDISEERYKENKLNLYANIFKSTKEGIMITDKKGYIIDVNEAFTTITGYTREDAIDKNPNILKSDFHGEKFYSYMWRDIKTLGYWTGEITNRRKNGNFYNELLTINTIKDKKGEDEYYIALFNDISLIKENERTLEKLAHYDLLTSLPNRVLLNDRIHQSIYNARRTNTTFALAFLDLDGFKVINDTYGHDVGDKLLIHVSSILQNTLRESDTVSRHGGDEFILILSNISKSKNIEEFLSTILLNISNPFKVNEKIIKISASIGVIIYDSKENHTTEILLKKADDAMYMAKELGKNRFHISS